MTVCLTTSENNQSQSNGGYPPYNVELVDENHYRIAIAVAGFAESELEVPAQDNLLVIKVLTPTNEKSAPICTRASLNATLNANSRLAENIHVRGASMVNRLLYIDLERVIPEAKKPRRIEIN
ncbi:Hsp20 family protein [Escherichia coli]